MGSLPPPYRICPALIWHPIVAKRIYTRSDKPKPTIMELIDL